VNLQQDHSRITIMKGMFVLAQHLLKLEVDLFGDTLPSRPSECEEFGWLDFACLCNVAVVFQPSLALHAAFDATRS
jgi:hypothetical protein